MMNEQAEKLQERAMQFAVDICALLKLLPRDEPGPTVRYQLAKSSTSTAMNYRSARRARSHAEFSVARNHETDNRRIEVSRQANRNRQINKCNREISRNPPIRRNLQNPRNHQIAGSPNDPIQYAVPHEDGSSRNRSCSRDGTDAPSR